VTDVGRGIIPSWEPIVHRRVSETYSEQQRDWQLQRRGRYLEFNLLYDRGVRFGLDGGREREGE
jgi:coproporphyrinogen III oxidase